MADKPYSCYALSEVSKTELASAIDTIFPIVKADHITFAYDTEMLPVDVKIAKALGVVIAAAQIQTLFVELNGNKYRPDGEFWHITWSVNPPHKASLSKSVLKEAFEHGAHTVLYFDDPIAITLNPCVVYPDGRRVYKT